MPRQRERTGTQEAAQEWFDEVRVDCFNSLTRVSFLRIFAGPMCVPLNRNYGKKKDRAGGRIQKDARTSEEKWTDQTQALKAYEEALEKWLLCDGDMVKRASDLSSFLAATVFECDDRYANKWTNYKPEGYLSMFVHADDPAQQFKAVADFYCRVIQKVFQGMRQEVLEHRYAPLVGDFNLLKAKCGLSAVEMPAEYSENLTKKIGWTLCAYLLLSAYMQHKTAESANVLSQILGVEIFLPDSRERTTVGYGGFYRVSLEQLRVLLVPLGREPSLEELEQVYEVLDQLGKPDRDTVREFMELLQRRVDHLLDRCCEDMVKKTGNERAEAVRKLHGASELLEKCGQWLE